MRGIGKGQTVTLLVIPEVNTLLNKVSLQRKGGGGVVGSVVHCVRQRVMVDDDLVEQPR